jgi:hypothetical protein
VFKEVFDKNDINFVRKGGDCAQKRGSRGRRGKPRGGKERREQVGSRNNIHKSYV